jgi:serine/threonine protein kinase
MPETLPKQYGKCLAVKQLGVGATAVVLLARHEGLNIPVAVKVLRKSLSQQKPNYAARFLREAMMAARLEHPNIVRVIDCGIQDGFHYMVMDYVDGPSCLQKIHENPQGIDWREATELIRQAAQGLGYAAHRDVIHRDVKPSNLMIDSTGRVRVTDLGLAKMTVKGVVELTQEFHTVGTPSYMSPEQIRSSSELDLRSDIYSLGATFYHMVCGQPPFSGEGPMEVVAKHLTERMVPPVRRRPDLPEELSAIICKMMAKRPDDRYQDYETLDQDLGNVLAGKEVTATGFIATTLTGQSEAELQRILDELNLQADLDVDDSPVVPLETDPAESTAQKAEGPQIDPFGPEDSSSYRLPAHQREAETALMIGRRPTRRGPNVALVVTLSVLGALFLLAVVLIVVIALK